MYKILRRLLTKINNRRFSLSRKDVGDLGEDIAVRFLNKQGYRILTRNLKNAGGEIDIVAEIEDIIVFVEVKARTPRALASPESAIDYKKQRKIRNTAKIYLSEFFDPSPVRFDTVTILFTDNLEVHNLTHTIEAFSSIDINSAHS